MTATADFLTAAPVLEEVHAREVTGNEWLSFPDVDLAGGGLSGLTVLHEGVSGLVELAGLPVPGGQLVAPFLYARPAGAPGLAGSAPAIAPTGGWRPVELAGRRWDREGEWLPGWTAEGADFRFTGRLVAPPGHRGAVYRLAVTNRSRSAQEFTAGLAGTWAETRQTLFAARPVHGMHHAWYDEWTQALVLECRPGTALLGWALGADKPLSTCVFEAVPVWQAAADSSLQLKLGLEAASSPTLPWRGRLGQRTEGEVAVEATGACLRFFLGSALTLAPGETGEVAFFLTVGTEGDGARLELVDLRRRGAAGLHDAALRDLAARAPRLNPARVKALLEADGAPADAGAVDRATSHLSSLLRRNLNFNRHYATGRALDSGKLALVTSRSPAYYVKGAFWARDAFLWSFPALLLTDRELAREALVLGLTRYAACGPFHACYLDGRPLYPGFELDELAAPLWAFDHYLEATGDATVWTEPGVEDGLRLILRRFQALAAEGRELEKEGLEPSLRPLRDGQGLLLPTFLDPSDDPAASHPYLAYTNLLAWRVLAAFARRAERRRDWEEERRQAARLSEALRRGLEDHLLCGKGTRRSFALATEGKGGGLVMGDNPAGSLALLAYLGFCDRTAPVFAHTFAGLNFPGNPFYFPGPFGGRGNRHTPFPWVIARASDLLAGDPTALSFFLHAPLDGGLACESVDPRTGVVKTGAAFASAAGWVAWCLYSVLG